MSMSNRFSIKLQNIVKLYNKKHDHNFYFYLKKNKKKIPMSLIRLQACFWSYQNVNRR